MFLLILVTLLGFGRGSSADMGSSGGEKSCKDRFCITVNREITAEAGLCVVIPCSFETPDYFKPQEMVWFKCEPSEQTCTESDIIFHSNDGKVQSRFKGRVSLLEPDMDQRNCSIFLNDLTESDSGSYQLRLNGLNHYGNPDGFTFPFRTTVSVKVLTQKPAVMVPSMAVGRQTTLTCTAPGLCSGSDPKITWTWRGAGGNASVITGNNTASKSDTLNAVIQRHSSTLTFNSSAELHGTNVTCTVSFTTNTITEETVTLNVTLLPKILQTSGCELQSETLTCTCISEGFPLPTINWPLLKNHTKYSVLTIMMSEHTVNSTISLTVKGHNSTVECFSSNDFGEMQQHLNFIRSSKRENGPVQSCGTHSLVLPWTVAAVSLIINVICVIWICRKKGEKGKKEKKGKPNQEDRTYMSLQKTEPSPEYDTIGQQPH